MKKLAFLTVLLGFFAIAIGYTFIYPYKFYLKAVSEGVYDKKLKLGHIKENLFEGKEYPLRRINSEYQGNPHLWKDFQFKDFYIPLPYDQPVYLFIPVIEQLTKTQLNLGFKIADNQGDILFKVLFGENKKLELETEEEWLFDLPIFKNYLKSLSLNKVWKDIFTLKIKNYENIGFLPLSEIREISHRTMTELIYDLFIIHLRKKYFPENMKNFGFLSDKNIGIIETTQKDMIIEQLFVLENEIIHQLNIQTKAFIEEPDFIRSLFFKNIRFKATDEDTQRLIYSRHQALSYEDRFSQRGLILLFCSLTHKLENEKMMKEMIRYLERGRAPEIQINPLYDYAFKKYGTNFSEIDYLRQENNEQYLRRKADEEQKQEKKKYEGSIDVKDEYDNDEDRVRDYLNKAKEKEKPDTSGNSLKGR